MVDHACHIDLVQCIHMIYTVWLDARLLYRPDLGCSKSQVANDALSSYAHCWLTALSAWSGRRLQPTRSGVHVLRSLRPLDPAGQA